MGDSSTAYNALSGTQAVTCEVGPGTYGKRRSEYSFALATDLKQGDVIYLSCHIALKFVTGLKRIGFEPVINDKYCECWYDAQTIDFDGIITKSYTVSADVPAGTNLSQIFAYIQPVQGKTFTVADGGYARIDHLMMSIGQPAAWAPAEGETLTADEGGGGMTEPTNLVKTQPDETTTYTVKAMVNDDGGHTDVAGSSLDGNIKLSANTSCHIGITIKPDKNIPSGRVWAWISYIDDAGHYNYANSSSISYVIPAGVWTRLEWTVTVPAGMTLRWSAISFYRIADETKFQATNHVVYPLTGGRIVRARGATALVSVSDGAKGDQGIPGKDGKSPTISVSKSGTVTTIVVTNADGSKTTQTVNDGVNGTPGAKGADGRTTYFHVKYSNDGGKTFTANSGETVGTYIGTCTDYNSADPTTVGSYTWARIKGDTGATGAKGADGVSPTVSISKSGSTTTISITDKNGTHTQTVLDGTNGTPGAKGADGKTSYLHVKYSNDGGNTFTANSGETVGDYIGTCTDFSSADPTTVSSYTWAKIKGATGATGPAGTSYWVSHEWIDVSASTYDQDTYYPVVGSNIPRNGTHRIKTSVQLNSGTKPKWSMHNSGFSVDLDIQTQASGWGTTHAVTYILLDDYDWCVSGAPSPVSFVQKSEASAPVLYLRGGGKYYVETTYSCNWSIKTSEYYTYQGTTKKGPVSPTKTRPAVEGKPIKGDKGDTGATGKGATSIIEQYYLSTSSTTQAGGSWSTTQPTWSSGKYIWTRSHITWTDGTTTDTTPVLAGGLNSANQNAFNANNTANNANNTANNANNTANSAQSTANSKNAIFYATSAPSGSHKVNDVWFDTAHGNKMYYWTGSTWSSGLFDTAAIKDGAVTGKLIAGQTITGDKIASRTIVATNIAAATITANEILGGTITADEIASRTLTADKIKTGAITSNEIAAGTITADKIKTGAITSNEIAAGTITADKIASRTLTADRIKAGAITANEIYGGTITADKINMNSLQANLAYVGNKSGRHIEIASDAVKLMLDGSTILGSFGSSGISLGNVFSVDSSGNGSYSGKITAKSGTIGGWTIQDSQLYIKNQQGNEVFLRNGDIGAQDVLVVKNGSDYPFYIRANGDILATKGTIGGWTIDSGSLSRSTVSGSRTTKSLLADGKYAIYGNETTNDLVYNVSHTYDFIGYNYTRSWQFDDLNYKTCAILEYNKDTYDDYIFHMYNTGTSEEILMQHGDIRITGDLRVGADVTWAPGSHPAHLGGNVQSAMFNGIKLKNLIKTKYLTASNKKFVKNGSSNNTISVPDMSGYNIMGVYAATIDSDKVYPYNSYYDSGNKVFHVLGHNISGADVTTAIHGVAFYIANV